MRGLGEVIKTLGSTRRPLISEVVMLKLRRGLLVAKKEKIHTRELDVIDSDILAVIYNNHFDGKTYEDK